MFDFSRLWHRRRHRQHSHPAHPPTLPPELWMAILRFATHDSSRSSADPHGQLDSSISFLDLSHSNSDLQHRLNAYKTSLKTKTVLSLVCREWHWMAQDILYDFVWIFRAPQAKALASTVSTNKDLGPSIRRLHIETPTLERCDPIHLRTIIEHSPSLAAYSDYRSIRRQPHSSPDHLLSTLARPGNNLKRLSWTNYDYDRRDHSGCISFFLRLTPALGMAASDLDYLELSLCATDLVSPNFNSIFHNTVMSAYTTSQGSLPVHLPALRTLKLTLDNITFSILSSWSLPALRNLSVLSADFSYAGDGFAHFFKVHGHKIVQLELGHSTGAIEEHYLTTPPHHHHRNQSDLAKWCPNLREFICSADAEWNWESPDWIAPHVLLPAHPNVQLIGVRDMSKRLLDDLELYLARHPWTSTRDGGTRDDDDDDDRPLDHHGGPFFRLAEQMRSLLRREAFPNLRAIRDMSWESDLMRRVERMPMPQHPPRFGVWDRLPTSQNADEMDFGRWLTMFWRAVSQRCTEREVCLQDWVGDVVV